MNKNNPDELDIALNKPPQVRCAFVELVDPATLAPHPSNPNQHPPKQIELFIAIMQFSGVRRAVTVSNRSGFITKGHGQVQAFLQAGWKQIPVDFQDYDTEEQELADVVADNALARMSEMDNKQLQENLLKLDSGEFNMELTGFDQIKLEKIFTGFGSKMNEPVFSGADGAPQGESAPGEPGAAHDQQTTDGQQPQASHVRMVQLFLNEETQAEFLLICEYFKDLVGADNPTDITMEVMRSAYRSHTGTNPDVDAEHVTEADPPQEASTEE